MAELRSSGGRMRSGIVKLKIMVEKFQKSLLTGRKSTCDDSTYVPADVKEGHFAVIAVDNDEPKRCVVPLHFLTHPTFVRLLEEAAEEYGFHREGVLTIPCRSSELERILAEQWPEEGDPSLVHWDSFKMLVESCQKKNMPIS